jgi:hypothetical protein
MIDESHIRLRRRINDLEKDLDYSILRLYDEVCDGCINPPSDYDSYESFLINLVRSRFNRNHHDVAYRGDFEEFVVGYFGNKIKFGFNGIINNLT